MFWTYHNSISPSTWSSCSGCRSASLLWLAWLSRLPTEFVTEELLMNHAMWRLLVEHEKVRQLSSRA